MGQNRKSLGVDITQPEHLVRVRAHGVTLGWNVLALLAATAAGFWVNSTLKPIQDSVALTLNSQQENTRSIKENKEKMQQHLIESSKLVERFGQQYEALHGSLIDLKTTIHHMRGEYRDVTNTRK